jgi:S-adenosylmethionine:tRNA ribosyltransferase-isomerase
MVTRGVGGAVKHATFDRIGEFFAPGDLLVVNASATIPAALTARDAQGVAHRLHISTRFPDGVCVVESPDRVPTPGEVVSLPDGARATYLHRFRGSRRLWSARFDGAGDLVTYLYRVGAPIRYRHVPGSWPIEAYQNVYSSEAGSAEMPSAGRPFTTSMLERLRLAGVSIGEITLHTGVSSPERDEPPYEEFFRVPSDTAALVRRTRRTGHRVIAVGTSVVRALESAAGVDGDINPSAGWTDLVISPDRGVRFVDGVLTGFHEPRSTHLALLEAVAGRAHVERAYREALAARYLWHEFGDSHLLLAR